MIDRLTDQVEHFGGCLVINWHDRSLAPERLWYACYVRLLKDLKARGAWFATTAQAVAWFQKRRSVAFRTDGTPQEAVHANVIPHHVDQLPRQRLRIHRLSLEAPSPGSKSFIDVPFCGAANARITCNAGV